MPLVFYPPQPVANPYTHELRLDLAGTPVTLTDPATGQPLTGLVEANSGAPVSNPVTVGPTGYTPSIAKEDGPPLINVVSGDFVTPIWSPSGAAEYMGDARDDLAAARVAVEASAQAARDAASGAGAPTDDAVAALLSAPSSATRAGVVALVEEAAPDTTSVDWESIPEKPTETALSGGYAVNVTGAQVSVDRDALDAAYVVSGPLPTGGDDTATLTAFAAANAGRKVRLHPGRTYTITDTIEAPPEGVELDLTNVNIDATGMPAGTSTVQQFAFRAAGTIGSSVAVSDAIALHSRTVTGVASTAGLVKGDLILLRNEEPATPGQVKAWRDKGELNIVSAVTATTVTLAVGALHAYGANGIAIQKVTPARGVRIIGGNILLGGVGSWHSGVQAQYARDVRVDGTTITGAEDMGVTLNTVWNGAVTDCVVTDSTSPAGWSTGYGAAVVEGSRFVRVEGNTFTNCRHAVSGGGYWPAAEVDVIDNVAIGTTQYAFDCHESTLLWRFVRNTAGGCAGGFLLRGQHITADDNRVINAAGYGIRAYTWDGVTEQVGIKITNNYVFGAGQGIEVDGQDDGSTDTADSLKIDLVVAGNTVENIASSPIFIRHFRGATVKDNTIKGAPTLHALRALGISAAIPSSDLVTGGNVVTSATSNGIMVVDVDRVTSTADKATDCANEAIHMTRCTDVTVSDGRTYRGGYAGIRFDACTRVAVRGGVYSGSTQATGDGVRVTNSLHVTVNDTFTSDPRRGINISGTNYVIATGNNTQGSTATGVYVDTAATTKYVANNV